MLLIVRECNGSNPRRFRRHGSWWAGQRTGRQWEKVEARERERERRQNKETTNAQTRDMEDVQMEWMRTLRHLEPQCDVCTRSNVSRKSLVWGVPVNSSRRNLSLYHNRLISNFFGVLNLRHHLVVHFSDGSVVFVHSRSKTASVDVFHQWKNLFSVFLSTWFKNRRFSCIHCCIDKHRIFSSERPRLAQAWQVLEQVCIVHLFGIQERSQYLHLPCTSRLHRFSTVLIVLPARCFISRLKFRTQLGGHTWHGVHTSMRINSVVFLISTFRCQSFPALINGAVSPFAVISVATSPLRITLLPTSLGLVPLIGG